MKSMPEMDRSIELGVQYLVLVVWRRKTLFLLVALLVVGAVGGITLRMQPIYEAKAQLVSGEGGLRGVSPGTLRPDELPPLLSIIAQSDEVLRAAVDKVGLDQIVARAPPDKLSLRDRLRKNIGRLRKIVGGGHAPVEPPGVTRMDVLLPLIRKGLSVSTDPKAAILSISYRHPNPVIATKLANAIAQAVVDRQIELYGQPGAVTFFGQEQKRLEQVFNKASERLAQFSSRTRIYADTEQQDILLKRRNQILSDLAVTRGQMAEKTGERDALANALRLLAPVARSTYVSALVDNLADNSKGPPMDPRLRDRTTDPPLLLIRVYQDSMASLFQFNAELMGAQSLERQQATELANVNAELDTFSQNQLKYAELKRAVDQAAYNLDALAKRSVQVQLDAEANTAQFSSVKLLQPAVIPVSPVSPNMKLMAVLALVGGLLCGLTAVVLVDWIAGAPRQRPVPSTTL
ncbi:MAG: hypothetical protein HIU92_18535 [Proteobacteria bacterium]|nr:hypothetical protein [Pseudomonadota bacterium]